jgi:hypothetical protein
VKTGHLLFSAAQFIFASLVILLGGLFIGLEYAPHLRLAIAAFFLESTLSFFLVGSLILGCGILLMTGFYLMNRGIFYTVKMGKRKMSIDAVVIQTYVSHYWKQTFPEHELSVEVGLSRGNHIEMFVEFPQLPIEKQQIVLEKANRDLSQILSRRLGIDREFSLSVLIK